MTAPTEKPRDVIMRVQYVDHVTFSMGRACECGWEASRVDATQEHREHVADEIVKALDLEARERAAEKRGAVIDAAHLAHQRAWSEWTFGPGLRLGVIDHLRKELDEVSEDPSDLSEWVDVIILGFDGAWRAGHEPQAIIDGIKAKQARNEARSWPDWRTLPTDKAIEHHRIEGGGQ